MPAPHPAQEQYEADRGSSEREMLSVMRVARLVAGEYEELCVVRAVGAGGALLKCSMIVQPEQRVWIELNDDTPYWGTVLWQRGPIVGIAFDELRDPKALLSSTHGALDRREPSAPRLRVEAKGRIEIKGVPHDIWVHSLSTAGAGITFHPEYDDDQIRGENILFRLDRIDPIQATIRWYHEGRAGMEFANHMQIDQFTRWMTDCFGSGVMRRRCGTEPGEMAKENQPFGSVEIGRISGPA